MKFTNRRIAVPLLNGWKECPNRRIHFLDGRVHRLDGPAVVYGNGTKVWYRHGVVYREDGPAIEWAKVEPEWCVQSIHAGIDKEVIIGILGYEPVIPMSDEEHMILRMSL